MLVRLGLNLGMIAVLCTACSTFSNREAADAAAVGNTAVAGEAAMRPAGTKAYPRFSDAPSVPPARDDLAIVMENYNALMAAHDELTGAAAADISRAASERAGTVPIFIDGRRVEVSIEEAGARMEAAREAGANVLAWGNFVSTVINFVILAFVIFMLVRYTKRVQERFEKKEEEAAAAEEPAGPTEIELLTEIRDTLKGGAPAAPGKGPMG